MLRGVLSVAFVASTVFGGTVIDRPNRWPVDQWTEVGPASPDQRLNMIISVRRRNVDLLEETLMEVSTPRHPRYGDFPTTEELSNLVKPHPFKVAAVKSWIRRHTDASIEDISGVGDNLRVRLTVAEAESLLDTKYFTYMREEVDPFTGATHRVEVTRVKMETDYYVPDTLANVVSLVTPTHRFPPKRKLRVKHFPHTKPQVVESDSNVGADRVTPTYLRNLYNVGTATAKAANNSQGISSFQREYYSMTDVQTFWTDYNIEPCTVTDVPSNTPEGTGLEAELDVQYITSMGEGIDTQVWYNSGDYEDALMTWASTVYSTKGRPLLFSISYGATESYYGTSYIDQFNQELMMLGSIGVTVFFASGDSGAGGGCTNGPFDPDYPASSPYITAVGGVHGGTIGSNPLGEQAWIDGGGGFSTISPTPSWQLQAVDSYLKNNAKSLPDSDKYNSSGRGYPDIAAQSEDFIIIVNGKEEAVSGTSCASPTAAGIFALLNDLRKNAGMSELGFVNPFIYSTASTDDMAFNDCTDGYNSGCTLGSGFPAETGWDAATGWGSPDYSDLAKHVLSTGRQTLKLRRNQH